MLQSVSEPRQPLSPSSLPPLVSVPPPPPLAPAAQPAVSGADDRHKVHETHKYKITLVCWLIVFVRFAMERNTLPQMYTKWGAKTWHSFRITFSTATHAYKQGTVGPTYLE